MFFFDLFLFLPSSEVEELESEEGSVEDEQLDSEDPEAVTTDVSGDGSSFLMLVVGWFLNAV